MAMRTALVYLGILIIGLVLLSVGSLLGPFRVGTTPGSVAGESLVAIGLAFTIVGIGFFLAWANPQK